MSYKAALLGEKERRGEVGGERGHDIMKFHTAQEKKIRKKITVRGSGAQVFQSPLSNKQVGNFYGN